MRKLVALIGGVVALSAVALAAVPAAQAHKVKFKTTVEVTEERDDYLRGVIRSPNEQCLRNRKVEVRNLINGQGNVVATVRTNAQGEWEAGGKPLGFQPGIAVAVKKLPLTKKQRKQNRKKKNKHVHRCAPAFKSLGY